MTDANKPENGMNEAGGATTGCSCDCGGKCTPPTAQSGRLLKSVILAVIVIAALGVGARSLIRQSQKPKQPENPEFASVAPQNSADVQSKDSTAAETTVPEKPEWGEPLSSVTALNDVATDVDAVFILLSNEQNKSSDPAVKEMDSAATTIRARGVRIRSFYLKKEAPEYPTFSQQVSVPGVIVMAKGRGMSGVSAGQITVDKLIQAFVSASQPSSGCCPSGSTGSGCTK